MDYVYQVNSILIPGETQASTDRKIFLWWEGIESVYCSGEGRSAGLSCRIDRRWWRNSAGNLRDNHVNTEFIHQISGPCGHTVIQVDQNGQNCILLYGGANQSNYERICRLKSFHISIKGDMLLLQNEISELDTS